MTDKLLLDQPLTRRDWLKMAGLGAGGLLLSSRRASAVRTVSPRFPDLKHINLAGNENPFGPSPNVVSTFLREASNICRYPFREEEVLREMIADLEKVPANHILLGNGCDEILALAGKTFGKPGTNVISTRPTYLQITHHSELAGAQTRWIDHTETMHHDLEAMAAAIGPDTSLVYICNPDTPTGTVLDADQLHAFCREWSPRVPIFVDEVYLELMEDFETRTVLPLIREEKLPVIIGRSFSKMHALAGARIGYAVAAPETVEAMGRYRMSSLNFLGVAAARASLLDPNFQRYSIRRIREARDRFTALLDELGLKYTPSHGNFVFHHTGISIGEYQDLMRERGFLVGRPFPPYEDWCRISIGSEPEMKGFEKAMREVFGKPA